ncbi:hypothetical protein HNR70_002422 [Brachybacterium aquaticum]|uniref:Uncharacterized protein n=1 Tax=Brachybacterium aquaticum TaxID=1432564 RepID=A0A841ABL2_9MICO|nr:hypothetical protein [Brachybacterium aquaticum]
MKDAGAPRISQMPWSGWSRWSSTKRTSAFCNGQDQRVSATPASRIEASAIITSPTTSAWYWPAAQLPMRTGAEPT